MKQVQLVLAPYRPDKYEMGLLEYDYWRKRVDVFMGFLDEHDKKRYVGENSNKSIAKPYLISPDDKFISGDRIYHIPTMEILRCGGFMHSEKFEQDDVVHEKGYSYQKDCRKVLATPEEIGWFVTLSALQNVSGRSTKKENNNQLKNFADDTQRKSR